MQNSEIQQLEEQLTILEEQKAKLIKQRREIEKKTSREALVQCIIDENKEIEQKTDQLVNAVMSKTITFEEFSNQFIQLRTSYHLNETLVK